MIDVTAKPTTLRRAVAESTVEMRLETVAAIRAGDVPKGDVAEMTRATAMLGLKRTPELLPFCHPIPVDCADVRVEVEKTTVRIQVEVAAVARTGVEVEAMTGAAVAALNVYDMVKPLDPTAHITGVRLLKKSGGTSDFKAAYNTNDGTIFSGFSFRLTRWVKQRPDPFDKEVNSQLSLYPAMPRFFQSMVQVVHIGAGMQRIPDWVP